MCVPARRSLKVQTAAGEALEPHERAAAPGQSNQEGALLLFFLFFLAGCEWKEGGVLPSGWSSASLEGSCFPLTCVVSWEGCCVSSASGRAERHSHLQRGLGWRSGVHNSVTFSIVCCLTVLKMQTMRQDL